MECFTHESWFGWLAGCLVRSLVGRWLLVICQSDQSLMISLPQNGSQRKLSNFQKFQPVPRALTVTSSVVDGLLGFSTAPNGSRTAPRCAVVLRKLWSTLPGISAARRKGPRGTRRRGKEHLTTDRPKSSRNLSPRDEFEEVSTESDRGFSHIDERRSEVETRISLNETFSRSGPSHSSSILQTEK